MDVLGLLMSLDDELVDWMLCAGNTPEDRARLREITEQRARLERAINHLVAHRVKLAVLSIPDEMALLEQVNSRLRSAARRMDQAEQVMRLVGTAVDVASRVVTFAAA